MSPGWTFLLTLAYCLPVLVLVVPLLARRYPGERAIARRVRRRPARRRRPVAAPRPRLRVRSVLPSGGALLSASLAGRAPPAL